MDSTVLLGEGQRSPSGGVALPHPGGSWTTVKPGRQRRRRRNKHAAASDGERSEGGGSSHGSGSSTGSITGVAEGEPEQLSTSLPTRRGLRGLAAQAAAGGGSSSPVGAQEAASPRQQPLQHQQEQQVDGVAAQQAPAAAAAATAASLPRQDSLTSQSALSLADLPKAQLRSSKSDLVHLSAPNTSRTAHQDGGSGGVGGLEGIPEAAGARGNPGPSGVAGTAAARRGPGTGAPIGSQQQQAPSAQPFASYLAGELRPGPSYPTADVVWGQTERDRVYNALVAVPYQLERFMLFGLAACLDSFLAIFTLLPLRVGLALLALGRALLSRGGSTDSEAAAGDGAAGSSSSSGRRSTGLRGDQLFDILSAAMSLGVVVFLWNLNAGTLYFWMKDLTQELLKLSVLYTALELSDKICCSFGVDVLEALAASCTQVAAGWSRRAAFNLACDVTVASLLLVLHGATMMSQAMVFGVAMNSKKNTLVALLIAANFTEIKGTVLKRFDTTKLFALACQDVVERFHLMLILAFVLVEEMSTSGGRSPNPELLMGCLRIYAGEVVIDVIKHAVLGKFNEIRPGVYREYMRDLCDRVSTSQSHNMHKLVGLEPFAPAALAFRIAVTAAALRQEGGGLAALSLLQAARVAATVVALWAALLLVKLGLGYLLKLVATAYLQHFETARRGSRLALPHRRGTLGAAAMAQAAAAAGAKKEE